MKTLSNRRVALAVLGALALTAVTAPARAGEMLDVYLAQRDAVPADAFLADGVALRRVGDGAG